MLGETPGHVQPSPCQGLCQALTRMFTHGAGLGGSPGGARLGQDTQHIRPASVQTQTQPSPAPFLKIPSILPQKELSGGLPLPSEHSLSSQPRAGIFSFAFQTGKLPQQRRHQAGPAGSPSPAQPLNPAKGTRLSPASPAGSREELEHLGRKTELQRDTVECKYQLNMHYHMPAPSRSVRRQRQPGRRCRSKELEAQQSELLPCQPGTPAWRPSPRQGPRE